MRDKLTAELTDVGLFGSMPRYGDLSIHAAVDLRRSFSRSELERAVEATLRDFPVLGRRYEPRFFRDRWVPVEGPVSEAVHVVDEPGDLDAETLAWVRRPISGTKERPFRVVLMGRGGGSRLLLSVLHLAVDGAGMAAVGHVLGAHLYGVAPALPVDARRDVGRVVERLRWFHGPVLARDMAAALLQPLCTRAAGERERPYAASPTAAASFRHLSLSAADLARIKDRCGGSASINDVLVAALARAAAGRSSRGAVAVLYTMDLRRYAAAPRLTAANTSSILTVLVPRKDVGDLATTTAAVAAVTARQRRGLSGPAFLITPLLLGLGVPHALVRRLLPKLHPSVVDLPLRRGLLVTNVGRIDAGLSAFGDDIEALRVFGPIIDGVPIPAVVAYGFRGRLELELVAPSGLAPEALDEIALELREALELERAP